MITQPMIPAVILLPVLLIIYAAAIARMIRKKAPAAEKIFTALRWLAILLLVFLINLRIMQEQTDMDVEMKNVDILFVTDTTISMWAEDGRSGHARMKDVQEDLRYIMEELYGGSFALIRFDNRSQILAPFTQDADTVEDALETISAPDRYYARGSSLNTAYDDIEKLLISSSKKEDRQTCVFFISDGEITDDSELMSFRELAQYVDGGAVLGYGTEEGGKMSDGRYHSYVTDPETWKAAVSRIDEKNLRQIAADLGIEYIHMKSSWNVRTVCGQIRAASSSVSGKKDAVTYNDTYFYYVYPLIGLLVLESWLFVRKRRV